MPSVTFKPHVPVGPASSTAISHTISAITSRKDEILVATTAAVLERVPWEPKEGGDIIVTFGGRDGIRAKTAETAPLFDAASAIVVARYGADICAKVATCLRIAVATLL